MREDTRGFFWDDYELAMAKRTKSTVRTMPAIPNTGWEVPSEFPNLAAAKRICVDVETKDPQLLELGPGPRRDGYIVGVAIGADDDYRRYFPIRHEGPDKHLNMDPNNVMSWVRDTLTDPKQDKVGANLLYDLDFLASEDVHVAGRLLDVQIAEPLLDEHRRTYALSSLAKSYLNEGKAEEELYEWTQQAYGGPKGRRQAGNIWRAPITLAGPYAESDVDLPLRIITKQLAALDSQGLNDVFELETDLLPLLLAMRRQGVRVDVEKTYQARDALHVELEGLQSSWRDLVGFVPNVDAPDDLVRAFDLRGITYPRTSKGAPSFRKQWLQGISDKEELARLVIETRRIQKTIGTFIDGYILGHETTGRIHCEFHPLRTDDFGTVSGRFSSSNPNLQNIPSRDPELLKLVRGLFVPEEGCRWAKLDFSQIEPRLLLHYAKGPIAQSVRDAYLEDPDMDCYLPMVESIGTLLRRVVKSLYLGATYGMGIETMGIEMNEPPHAVKKYLEEFHEGAPYVREMFRSAENKAKRRGHIETLLGRRARFPFWESAKWGDRDEGGWEQDKAVAVERWGRVVRAGTHKSLNRLIQGGAADIMKLAMREYMRRGLMAVLGPPLLTVHDELDLSVPRTKEGDEALLEARDAMEQCVSLRVAMRVDIEVGNDWGHVATIVRKPATLSQHDGHALESTPAAEPPKVSNDWTAK